MDFYDDLGSYYDYIFPENSVTTSYLQNNLEKGSKVLDIACATGNYSIALARASMKVMGIDLDLKMLNLAREKALNLDVEFKALDMTKISQEFRENEFDMAFCVGNSIVHLPSIESIRAFCSDVNLLLKPGSSFKIQIVNYDRILSKNIKALPLIERKDKDLTFIRNYELINENRIDFNTELKVSGKSFKNSVPLIPLKSETLSSLLGSTGFKQIQISGDFKGSKHSKDSYATVVQAIKD